MKIKKENIKNSLITLVCFIMCTFALCTIEIECLGDKIAFYILIFFDVICGLATLLYMFDSRTENHKKYEEYQDLFSKLDIKSKYGLRIEDGYCIIETRNFLKELKEYSKIIGHSPSIDYNYKAFDKNCLYDLKYIILDENPDKRGKKLHLDYIGGFCSVNDYSVVVTDICEIEKVVKSLEKEVI